VPTPTPVPTPMPTPTPSPSPSPSPTPLSSCGTNQVVGSPPTCDCDQGRSVINGRCK
jgi:hypothetical protein